MDIFNEVKEAVLSATPGEDTRNYYRNQGMAIERERIIKLLEDNFDDSCLWRQIRWSPVTYEGFDKKEIIALIKGEK